ncbi:hypothetical protein J1N35_035765 [Gossypium stocksii]|uniref:BZIP domain-containing protein n=1 Tax=Gossypium stocksii TaxID=47602 RepID=A0A9D3ZRZ5_9ROSI|nr:hypothetical protein J1N35_035765 [Gossypium stocksii]
MADFDDFCYPYHVHDYMLQGQESHRHQQSPTLPRNFRRGSTSEKQLDAKVQKQKKEKTIFCLLAYVQQLESNRIKLTQLEQDLQRARSQGFFLGGSAGTVGNISSGKFLGKKNN